jgi:hypothetical protein
LISPCNCKGSLEHVHSHCLKLWLAARIGQRRFSLNTYNCELCNYQIQSTMKLKPISKILTCLLKKMGRKFKKDKWFVLKLFLYGGYMYMCFSKFHSSIKIMMLNFASMKSGQRKLYTVISLLYLLAVFMQIGSLLFKELSVLYRKTLFQIKLSCYDIIFKQRNEPQSDVDQQSFLHNHLVF